MGLAAGQLGLGLLQVGFQSHLVHLGDELAGGDPVVVVHIEPVDDAGDLSSDLHEGDGLDGARGGHGVADVAPGCDGGLKGDVTSA